jgi:hypothetical protein
VLRANGAIAVLHDVMLMIETAEVVGTSGATAAPRTTGTTEGRGSRRTVAAMGIGGTTGDDAHAPLHPGTEGVTKTPGGALAPALALETAIGGGTMISDGGWIDIDVFAFVVGYLVVLRRPRHETWDAVHRHLVAGACSCSWSKLVAFPAGDFRARSFCRHVQLEHHIMHRASCIAEPPLSPTCSVSLQRRQGPPPSQRTCLNRRREYRRTSCLA